MRHNGRIRRNERHNETQWKDQEERKTQ
jgi:hypothetical protein